MPPRARYVQELPHLSLGRYGTEKLKQIGFDVGHHGVGKLVRKNGLSVVSPRKHKVTISAGQAIARQSAEIGQ